MEERGQATLPDLFYSVALNPRVDMLSSVLKVRAEQTWRFSVAVYNIDRCIMSILIQQLLHADWWLCYFLARHAGFLQNLRAAGNDREAGHQTRWR
jgi:hypothetical protein